MSTLWEQDTKVFCYTVWLWLCASIWSFNMTNDEYTVTVFKKGVKLWLRELKSCMPVNVLSPTTNYSPRKLKTCYCKSLFMLQYYLQNQKLEDNCLWKKKRWRHKTFIPLHIQDIYTPSYLVHRVKAAYFVFSKAKRPTPTPLSSRAITNAWAASLCQRVLCILSKKWPRVQWHSHQARCSKFPVITLPWCPTAWGSKDGPRS